MLTRAKCLATVVALILLPVNAWGQEPEHAGDTDLLVRLSYDSSANVQAEKTRRVCLAVSRDGAYRISRTMSDGQAQRLEGKMPEKELQQLNALLTDFEFRALSGNHGGLIRQKSESFGAEIPLQHPEPGGIPLESAIPQAHRLQWLNADGENPFPAAVSKVVEWLKRFEPRNGRSFEYAEFPDVCPSGGLRLIQPAIAENGQR